MRAMFSSCLVGLAILVTIVSAGEFQLYPGAKMDEQATQEAKEAAAAAKMTDTRTAIYTTADAFAKVVGFYQGKAVEHAMPSASGSTGKPNKYEEYDLWEAYFIFDGAKNLADSKLWIKVQRPYIGDNVRDVTAIVVTEKR
ncbi:MAG: hypothetical protein GX443_10605 [Deltaproteobacteria bacterium]|nr:hypothetical protein [Deltaproteobacteria bacterium]